MADLSIVSSQPLPPQGTPLSIVSSQPLPQVPDQDNGILAGISRTISKTAHMLNIENVLANIGEADDLAGQGRWKEAAGALVGVAPGSQAFLGNPHPFQEQKDFVQDTIDKYKSGDKSGAAANVLSAAVMNAPHVPAAADMVAKVTDTNAAQATGAAIKGAVQGGWNAQTEGGLAGQLKRPVHAASTILGGIGGYVGGPSGAAMGAAIPEVAYTGYRMVQGARQALADRAAANAAADVEARIAASRANPATPGWQAAGTTATPAEAPAAVQPILPAAATVRAMGPQPAPVTVPPRVSLPEQAGIQPTPSVTSAPVEPIAPDAAALQAQRTARQEVNARIRAQQKAAEPAAPPAAASLAGTSREPAFLNDIAVGQYKSKYANLSRDKQIAVEDLADKLRPKPAATGSAAPAAASVPPATPTAQPTAPQQVERIRAQAPATQPPSPAPPPAAPETPVAATPAAPSATLPTTPVLPTAAESLSSLQRPPSPAAPAPPSGVPVSSTTQVSVPEAAVTRQQGTTAEGLQRYYPTGRPTHIPTPEELELGVYGQKAAGEAASGRVLRAENEKGYAAALWAYRNGITDPSVFDRMTEGEKRDFMNGRTNPDTGEFEPGAIQHAKEMGNPAPKGKKYQVNTETHTILGENTLEFAKAHLRKLVTDGGPRPATAPEQVQRIREAQGTPATALETVEGMRQEQTPKPAR